MAKNIVLHMLDIFKDTDEYNKISKKEIIQKLKANGFEKIDRHTIDRNVDVLNDFGFDIVVERGRNKQYYLGERLFEEWEVKLICDMICECYFLSESDSITLIEKMHNFTGKKQRLMLDEIDLYKKKSGSISTNTKYAINELIGAIHSNRKVEFQYCEYDDKLKLIAKEKIYIASPYKFALKNGHYYLILNKEGHNDIAFYRVDRIINVKILSDSRRSIVDILGQAYETELINIIKGRLYSYDGESIRLIIKVRRSALGEIVDNFYDENIVLKAEEDYLTIAVKTCKSEGLYYWLMQHLETVTVVEPEKVRDELIGRIDRVMKGYMR